MGHGHLTPQLLAMAHDFIEKTGGPYTVPITQFTAAFGSVSLTTEQLEDLIMFFAEEGVHLVEDDDVADS